jgi:peptide/nickel transport system substrate-binding protein
LYQTAINGPRQKTQAIVKQACQKAGIDVELKSVVASVFFSSDVANPDTYAKFYADIEMFQIPMSQPDPSQLMRRFHSRYVATKENKWQGVNFPRWVNKDYDAAVDAAETETDAVKRAALYIKANEIMMQDVVFIPVMHRLKVEAAANSLRPVVSGWANETDNLFDWYREATG